MPLKNSLRIFGKRTTDGVHAAYYNHVSKKAAFEALDAVEAEMGKLSAALKNRADDYAMEVLGGKKYAPWLYVYTALSGEFKEGWIPDNYYHLVAIPNIQGDYGKISFLKPLNRKIFGAAFSPDIAFFVNGEWYDPNFVKIQRNVIKAYAFANSERVIYKMDQSFQGLGIRIFDKANFNVIELESSGNGSLQKYIEQHRFLADFHSASVATLRMTTVIDMNGQSSLRAAYLRLGRAADTHVKSDSHIRIPLDLESGALGSTGYLPDWRKIAHHPDTLIPFSNLLVPGYQEAVRSALSLHQSFPLVRAIGWDFAVDKDNRPVLMEWNGYGNDIKFSEATQGPCFKDLGWEHFKFG